MNRIPAIVLIVFLIFVFLFFLPDLLPKVKKKIACVFLFFYTSGIVYLTLLTRLVSFREIYLKIFNMYANPDIYAVPEVGNRGSEWSAEQRGIHGLELLKYSLSDPNSVLYIIPSCLMNLLLFVPYGMLYRCVAADTQGRYKKQCLICAIGILIIELLQYFLSLGQFDLLDIIFNTLGFLIGMRLWDRYLAKKWYYSVI